MRYSENFQGLFSCQTQELDGIRMCKGCSCMERKRMPLPEEILPASKGSNNEWQEVSSGHST